jgi:LacI family transcriptional regulator
VLEAAERLGYAVNAPAQAFARGRTSSVVLVVSDLADPFFASIAAGALRAADTAGQLVSILVTDRDPQRELGLVRLARQQRPAAIVLAGSRREPDRTRDLLVEELDAMRAAGTGVATIGQASLPFSRVVLDDVDAGRRLAAGLAESGYRRPLVLAGPRDLRIARERLRGLTAGFAELGIDLPADRIVTGGFGRDDGEAVARDLIERGAVAAADLVVAVNDVMAIGALAALRAARIRVPDDVGVAGFDDIQPARDAAPPLTTMRVPLEEAGRAAVELALAAGEPEARELAATLVQRESTRRP